MKWIKITSWKKVHASAFVQALLSVLFCGVYTRIIMIFTGGWEFVGKVGVLTAPNGIRHDVVLVVCGILAGLIPIIMLRYTNSDFLFTYIPMSIIYYIALMLLCVLFVIDDSFDLITYALIPIPIGSAIGTVIAILINYCNNRK